MAGVGDPFTDVAKPCSSNDVIEAWQKKGAGSDVKPHGAFTGSTCPGPEITKWLAAGRPEPGVTPKPEPSVDRKNETPPWLMDFIAWRLIDDADPKQRPKGVPKKVPPSAWEAATATHRLLSAAPPQEPFLDWAQWRLQGAQEVPAAEEPSGRGAEELVRRPEAHPGDDGEDVASYDPDRPAGGVRGVGRVARDDAAPARAALAATVRTMSVPDTVATTPPGGSTVTAGSGVAPSQVRATRRWTALDVRRRGGLAGMASRKKGSSVAVAASVAVFPGWPDVELELDLGPLLGRIVGREA